MVKAIGVFSFYAPPTTVSNVNTNLQLLWNYLKRKSLYVWILKKNLKKVPKKRQHQTLAFVFIK